MLSEIKIIGDWMLNVMFLENGKIGQTIAVSTAGVGLGITMDWISGLVGLVAVSLGAVLSLVLIVVHSSKWWLERKKLKLEIQDIQEAKWEREARKRQNLPLRRKGES